jgi:DNA-3-methyladenine glycosylase I
MSREIIRCKWCLSEKIYIKYHDNEWGKPIYEDSKLFEYLLLETFQTGLKWITILKKRECFKKSFDDFNYKTIANYSDAKIDDLCNNPEIIRNRLKIEASRTNASAFIKIQKEFKSFSKYIWGFVNEQPIKNNFKKLKDIPKNTPLSKEISKNLKARGFKFIGETIIYAYMQAIGMVNDHTTDCFRYNEV